ncbi:hypothetical protein DEO72_LG2g1787 [Vigna unguiculata]|uniref:Uncharacterized protein n=1 Tax=Vigna unguiculata TaxID=3917 RepID=A0A4D6L0F5_VIGUN|nr:hypothetical protein DEO72_LG2g1787 [Vigna unguiculata]
MAVPWLVDAVVAGCSRCCNGGSGSVFALAVAMEVLVAVADLHSVEDRSNLARVRLQVQTMLLLLRNAGCCCGAGTRGRGGAAERDAVASMEVGRGYGSLQVARWLTTNICRSSSLMARKMVVAVAFRRRCVTEHYGFGRNEPPSFLASYVHSASRTDILAQVSSSRLGENSRSSPKVLPRALAQAASLSDTLSRSGEKASPKRELVKISQGPLLQSRLSESLQLKRGNFPHLSEGS